MLCYASVEDQNHLFFDCPFSKCIWKEVLGRNVVNREVRNREGKSVLAITETKGEDFRAKLRSLSLVAAVYLILKERNYS